MLERARGAIVHTASGFAEVAALNVCPVLQLELPFDRLVEELNPRRDPAYSPVFQVMMSLQNTPTPDLDLRRCSRSLRGIPQLKTELNHTTFQDQCRV